MENIARDRTDSVAWISFHWYSTQQKVLLRARGRFTEVPNNIAVQRFMGTYLRYSLR